MRDRLIDLEFDSDPQFDPSDIDEDVKQAHKLLAEIASKEKAAAEKNGNTPTGQKTEL